MSIRIWLAAAATAAVLTTTAFAEDAKKGPNIYSFGTLKAPTVEAAKQQAEDWLKSAGKFDAAAFAKIWDGDRNLLDRVGDTLAIGSDAAKKLLAEARDPANAAPKEVPAMLRDNKQNPFLRNNLALLYARSLSGKRVFEEALDALKCAMPEQVVDPAAYYFHKAVAEHAMVMKKEAMTSILRLLDEVTDAPERYKTVSALMALEMQSWKDDDKDLENIARLMDNIERRLDLSRGGPKTQELQKKVVFRLDEIIKEIENQVKNGGKPCNCPGGDQQPGQGNSNQPNAPMPDSYGGVNGGPGLVDQKKLKHLAENWGKLPEKERAKAMMEITKDLPPRYREVIENYFKTLARTTDK